MSVCEAVSSVLSTLEEQRKLAYTQSGIDLVSEVDNKYPLSDVIMKRLAGHRCLFIHTNAQSYKINNIDLYR